MRNCLAGLFVLFLSACTVAPTAPMHSQEFVGTTQPPLEQSLFAGDAAVLSDEAIGRILGYEYRPPASSRVALMPFGREVWSTWSEEMAVASEAMEEATVERLVRSTRVGEAAYLPSILVPQKRTVPHLREAAARFQADLLVVYRTFCRSFDQYRFFSADRSRAYCGVEAVLLDVRTGLVPFTSVAYRNFDVLKGRDDSSLRETRLRAELSAAADALGEVSGDIVAFLDADGGR